MLIEEDQAKVKIFSSAVSLILSEIHANIKKKLIQSIKDTLNIGELTAVLVLNTNITITIQLCGCVAWLRSLIHMGAVKTNEDFWDNVDVKLVQMHLLSKGNLAMLNKAFINFLKDDHEHYGAPKKKVADMTSLTGWQVELDHASKANPATTTTEEI
ncbi:hypothetical protein FRB97_005348 [Tulasnella sp. 331]|nr:hypothetical protein FRB97_005348 [Tulasnella sp. 331]KAG8866412.1 hypothetical protein FRB98_004745 [Tulasnella sp. 332]